MKKYIDSNVYEYEILETLTEFQDRGDSVLRLTLISWHGGPAKFDLRTWLNPDTVDERPGKGITFSREDGELVLDALRRYYYDNGEQLRDNTPRLPR